MVKCPYDEEILWVEIVDEEDTGTVHCNYCSGECPKCGRHFEWTEVFKYYHGREDFKEVMNDDEE